MLSEKKSTVNLRTVADHVGLAPCSVSAILNNTAASNVIPQSTKDRVLRAAAELNYRPNLWARSLRTKRTRMVAVVASDFGNGMVARVVAGAQRRLHQKGYLLALGTAAFSEPNFSAQFQQRGIEGIIAIDAMVAEQKDLPVAKVEVSYMPLVESLSPEGQNWLAALGESAAETIIQRIEHPDAARESKVEVKMPQAVYELPQSDLAARTSA